jgi:glycosyltransferase involved in cell wall biosynthesis
MHDSKKVLTIAIPTYNRAEYLKLNLNQIRSQFVDNIVDYVEILVSDNCSTDNTQIIVNEFKDDLKIQYFRNEKNLGWGENFFLCFEKSKSNYVLLLGDDDLICDGFFKLLIEVLLNNDLGVVAFKSYGFDLNWKDEFPIDFGKKVYFKDPHEFLLNVGPLLTMISCCIINKKYVNLSEIRKLPLGNFSHVHLILTAVLNQKNNLFISKYLVAAKRNNSSNYHFSKVFVEEIWSIYSSYDTQGLNMKTIELMKKQWLFTYYPFYWLKQRLDKDPTYKDSLLHCDIYFKDLFEYKFWNRPILYLPRTLAIFWGLFATFIGRTYNGEFIRGVFFLFKKFFKKLNYHKI